MQSVSKHFLIEVFGLTNLINTQCDAQFYILIHFRVKRGKDF